MLSINSKNTVTFFFFLAVLFLSNISYAALSVSNTSTYRGNGRWDWTIFIDADNSVLSQINCVEYTLHPTFPNPVRKVCDKKSKFALSTNGWGTFVVKVKVFYKNNTVENLEHQLVFKEKTVASESNIGTENWSREIGKDWWEWGVKLTGSSAELDKVRCVEYKLHRSFRNPVRNICTRNNNFELKAKGWGSFTIPVKVMFKDGKILELTHDLKLGE